MPGEGEGVGEEVGGCCGCLGSVGWWWLGGVGVMVGEDGGEMMEGVVVEGDGVAGFIGDGVEADGAVEFPVGVVGGAEADFLMGCMGVVERGVDLGVVVLGGGMEVGCLFGLKLPAFVIGVVELGIVGGDLGELVVLIGELAVVIAVV